MSTQVAYKLFRVRKDGSIGSLFVNASRRLPVGQWMRAQAFRPKTLAFRPGWHATAEPNAPHLKLKLKTGEIRQWYVVEISNFKSEKRPVSQGGMWYLAKRIRILRPV